VSAESLYEAAALGLEALVTAELTEARPGLGSTLEITVHPPTVTHRVRIQQLKEWLKRTAVSPRELVLKKRLRERIGE